MPTAPAPPPAADRTGVITAVRGSVVDARFPGDLPPLRQRLLAGRRSEVVLEVSEHLGADTARGIALTATQGLAHRAGTIRDRDQSDRPALPAGARRQGRPVRRRGCGQDGHHHRADP